MVRPLSRCIRQRSWIVGKPTASQSPAEWVRFMGADKYRDYHLFTTNTHSHAAAHSFHSKHPCGGGTRQEIRKMAAGQTRVEGLSGESLWVISLNRSSISVQVAYLSHTLLANLAML